MSRPGGEDVLFGRRPVLAALQSERPVHRLLLLRGGRGDVVDGIRARARRLGVPVDERDRPALDRAAGGGNHQGVVALLAARSYADFEQVLSGAREAGFLVFLDGIQDPHNLGAILRTAHALGADAAVIPRRGGAGLTSTAAKAAAGAAEQLPLCRVANLRQSLTRARGAGLWVTGLDAAAGRSFDSLDFTGPGALVVGAEGRGLRPLVRQSCDFIARIPMGREQAGSMNASVAAGIALYEVFRQRRGGRP
ncbi:MAG: 23S rRNA (guanosine(2251)-2'-O)-methyltransferase RlmB [Gemmatimonadaceae bacterium]|nr:23S rRNA (guanosine(2251)-2'-O)-methyltransferase RlmB [Gemmatimonadaceae bacterium]